MHGCIFCKIISGEIPSSKVYEDSEILAFLDISPVTKGHVLVIPKTHHETLVDIPCDLQASLIKTTSTIATAIKKGLNADGYNVQMNNHPAAGQVVFHAHIHIVPRYQGDGLTLWAGGDYECGEQEEVLERIRARLKGK